MGLKNYVLSGIVRIIYNLKTHTGSIMPCPGQPDLQALGNIVLELVQHVPRFQWYKLYFDNWYTSVLLEKTLMSRELLLLALAGVTVFTTASFQMTNP